jgi:hypothetical protein
MEEVRGELRGGYSMEKASPLWIYVGSAQLRTSSGRVYVHLNPRVVEAIGARHVLVRAVIEPAGGCETNIRLPLGDIIFRATLTKVNGTYRVTVPRKIGRVLAELSHCIILHVSIAPVFR